MENLKRKLFMITMNQTSLGRAKAPCRERGVIHTNININKINIGNISINISGTIIIVIIVLYVLLKINN